MWAHAALYRLRSITWNGKATKQHQLAIHIFGFQSIAFEVQITSQSEFVRKSIQAANVNISVVSADSRPWEWIKVALNSGQLINLNSLSLHYLDLICLARNSCRPDAKNALQQTFSIKLHTKCIAWKVCGCWCFAKEMNKTLHIAK